MFSPRKKVPISHPMYLKLSFLWPKEHDKSLGNMGRWSHHPSPAETLTFACLIHQSMGLSSKQQ